MAAVVIRIVVVIVVVVVVVVAVVEVVVIVAVVKVVIVIVIVVAAAGGDNRACCESCSPFSARCHCPKSIVSAGSDAAIARPRQHTADHRPLPPLATAALPLQPFACSDTHKNGQRNPTLWHVGQETCVLYF